MHRIDARQDSLLGPLLAELDSMSNQPQQVPPSHAASIHSRNSMSYQSNPVRPIGSSQPSSHGKFYFEIFILENIL